MAPEPRPLCPRCGKKFKDQPAVLNHINQPYSSCRTHYEELIQVAAALRSGATTTQAQSLTPESYSRFEENEELASDYMDTDPDFAMNTNLDNHENFRPNTPASAQHFQPTAGSQPFHTAMHPKAAYVFGQGETYMDSFDKDEYAHHRKQCLHYPFASREEWEIASFLLCSQLSMGAIDKFLKLELVQRIGLSFHTAKDLRSRAEILPNGPSWRSKPWKTVFPTKRKLELYYRDPIDCLQSLLQSPLIKDYLQFKPFQLFRSAEGAMRVYTEWLSGNAAWRMQDQLPQGATLLGAILSSDKTQVSRMTGNRAAHPLLISLANLNMDFRMKSSNNAFLLLALLPIPHFIHRNKRLRGVLADRLVHECLDFVLRPLKTAAEIGIMLSDPLGWRRWCFTPLASYIVDTPESCLVAGVGGKTSSVTMANYKQFGDDFRHQPRNASTTLAQLRSIKVDPWDLQDYFKKAQSHRLNGVHQPFWADWPLSDPSIFLTPEPLHHWHKQFWDHDVKWCINAIGAPEFDFRFSVLHPHTGLRHFKEGISSVKQVTGREHRDIQRYIIGVIADSVVTKGFLIAIRALLDFRYLAQSLQIDENVCLQIDASLKEFHSYKGSIIAAGARRGKGNVPINNWQIPKLEFMQSVVSNIRENGVPIQWSADMTEHAHIVVVKEPVECGNNRDHESQICRYLDRREKCRRFNLSTAMRDAGVDFYAPSMSFHGGPDLENDNDETSSVISEDLDTIQVTTTSGLLNEITPVARLTGGIHSSINYFTKASHLESNYQARSLTSPPPKPFRTFSTPWTAFHLTRDPSFKRMLVDDVASKFNIPDLREALADYIQQTKASQSHLIASLGGRRYAVGQCELPFTHLEVWKKARIQRKSYYFPHDILPAKTINASPPQSEWTFGRHDAVIVNLKPSCEWPQSGIEGHQVVELRLIFRVVPLVKHSHPLKEDCFLSYVRRFDIVPQVNKKITGSPTLRGPYPEPSSSLYIVKRARRANNDYIGGILPLQQIRELIDLIPRFGKEADRRLTRYNVLEYCSEFWLNKYFDKELFFALSHGCAPH